jgi:hypothetical protein
VEARLPNFWEQNFASGSPAAYLPYQKSLSPGRKAVCISEAGYMAGSFACQHPKMTKPTKFKIVRSVIRKARRAGCFRQPRQRGRMWGAVENLQEHDRTKPRHRPETCRIWV